MVSPRVRPVTPLARPIDLGATWNASNAEVAARFDRRYAGALDRLPGGAQAFRGLPFLLGDPGADARWVLLDRPVTIDLRGQGRASHLVVAHFCDSWRDATGARPPGAPVGWVLPIGEPLARYDIELAERPARSVTIRRRFEVNDGIIGWGSLPFAAVGHQADETLDWRGPHPRQAPGRYAPAGHAGPLTMIPGAWGAAQTGIVDHVPTAQDDITCWLHAIELPAPGEVVRLTATPLGDRRPGSGVVLAAVTLFDGTADPLVAGPRRQVLVRGFGGTLPDVDLGTAIRARRLPDGPAGAKVAAPDAPIGWGHPAPTDPEPTGADGPSVVDLALAPDARLRFGSWIVPAGDLDRPLAASDGRVSIEPLPAATVRVEVRIRADGAEAPARVRFVAADGRYLPPLGHRDEVNPGIMEDAGADLILGADTYAYVDGRFVIDLPPGAVEIEVVKGFDHRPIHRRLEVSGATREVDIELERTIDLRPDGWLSADSHVHFLSPSSALIEAAAEGVDHVHVLATQWGDHVTSVTDLPWGSMSAPGGRHQVLVGTENRQNMLGHLALLGSRRPVLPMASGGGPEGRLGDPLRELLADWADRCHASGGLVVAAHFPLPYAEIATDIVTGRIDAVEMQCFAPGLDNPSILEWYRFLNCGYRLPVVGGTDKMSAEVPVGAVRTYARLDPTAAPTFDAWAAAVRAGRTFATSGPVIELSVDGHEPGDVISLPPSGGRLDARVRVRAAQPVIAAVEIVVNGRAVAVDELPSAASDHTLAASIDVHAGAWIAARSRSRHDIHSAFATSMAAHSSPVYVEVRDRPLFAPDDGRAILEVIEGTLDWVRRIAVVEPAGERKRMAGLIAASAATLRDRISRTTAEVP